ncbi:MAG TPA: hypothetical protein DDZ60_00320 [Planktothrix sp. UBA10369]|jgi:Uncharacterized protein containing caspase domain|nr:hypothetical protein [Planktothrix sp. UBA10369]
MLRRALVIGINRYPYLEDSKGKSQHLTYSAGDAEEIGRVLSKYGRFQVTRLPETFTGDAMQVDKMGLVDQDTLETEISQLFNPTDGYIPSTALLFFAGHGLQGTLPPNEEVKGYLATSQADNECKYAVSFDWLFQQLIASPVTNQIVWLDCCHSGEFTNLFAQANAENGGKTNNVNRLFIAACRESEIAYSGIGGHGLLTSVLLKGLDPAQNIKGEWITSTSLNDFVHTESRIDPVINTFGQRFRSNCYGEQIDFWQKLGEEVRGDQSPPDAGESISSSSQNQFSALIADKTQDFVGREYVFNAIAQFISSQPKGYFTITGDPGQGKSAILAKYVQDIGCIAHFNVQVVGPKTAGEFLKSVCTQLIDRYFSSSRTLPSNATEDGQFLGQLLEEVAARKNNKPVIIAVDALDEVDSNSDRNANILYLPPYLPEGIYFVMTIRRGVEVPFITYTPQDILSLLDYQEDSQRDVRQYIQNRINGSERLRSRIEERRETLLEFIDKIAAKSENNFMYLRYVLEDIEKGLYQDLTLERFPQGLQSYYEFHWRRMGMTATPLPDEKIKIVYILGEVRQPVSRQQICDFSGEDTRTVQTVLNEWEQFLHELEKDSQKRYIVYHASFRDFLHRKDILEKTGVTIPGINQLIAKDQLNKWRNRRRRE